MIVRKTLIPGTPLTPEQIQRLDALKNYPIVYDEDCPEMTDEQLRQAEGFISILIREKSDYTKWRRRYFDNVSSDDFHAAALSYGKENPL